MHPMQECASDWRVTYCADVEKQLLQTSPGGYAGPALIVHLGARHITVTTDLAEEEGIDVRTAVDEMGAISHCRLEYLDLVMINAASMVNRVSLARSHPHATADGSGSPDEWRPGSYSRGCPRVAQRAASRPLGSTNSTTSDLRVRPGCQRITPPASPLRSDPSAF